MLLSTPQLRQDPSTHEGKMFEDDIIVPQGLKKCLQAGVEDCKPGLVLWNVRISLILSVILVT